MYTLTKYEFKKLSICGQLTYINNLCRHVQIKPCLGIDGKYVIDVKNNKAIDDRDLFNYALKLHLGNTALKNKVFMD